MLCGQSTVDDSKNWCSGASNAALAVIFFDTGPVAHEYVRIKAELARQVSMPRKGFTGSSLSVRLGCKTMFYLYPQVLQHSNCKRA